MPKDATLATTPADAPAPRTKSIFEKFFRGLIEDGLNKTLVKTYNWLKHTEDPITQKRLEISRKLSKVLNSTVSYGPFRGLRIAIDPWWSELEKAAMLLGLYEQEVLYSLTAIPARHRAFVNIGAGAGYYGIGVLINNQFEKSYCFEASEQLRKIIHKNAELNNVSTRVEVRGTATRDFHAQITAEDLADCVLFIDIEGGEFELLDHRAFATFKDSIMFVELHDWLFEDGDSKLNTLKRSAAATHAISELTMTSRDLSKYQELRSLSDTERWLICSEGRPRLMTWLRFDPIAGVERGEGVAPADGAA
jgi:hypothetical protein